MFTVQMKEQRCLKQLPMLALIPSKKLPMPHHFIRLHGFQGGLGHHLTL